MNVTNVKLCLLGLGLLAGACSSTGADQSDAGAPPAESAEQAAEGAYGSDQRFDKLYDQCGSGDREACETLYWESPVGSEYEAFALSKVPDVLSGESGAGAGEHNAGPVSTQPFEEVSPGDVAGALEDAGVSTTVSEPEAGNISGSFEGYTIYLEGDKYGWEGVVNLDRYSAESVLEDAIAMHQSGFGSSLISHVYGDGIISISEGSRPEHFAVYEEAMDALGAQLVADHRG